MNPKKINVLIMFISICLGAVSMEIEWNPEFILSETLNSIWLIS